MITTHFNNILSTDTQLMKVLRYLPRVNIDGPWIAGGALCRSILGQDLSCGDIDFFFRTKEQYDFMVHRLSNLPNVTISDQVKKKCPTNGVNEIYVEIEIAPGVREGVNIQMIYFKYYLNLESLIDAFDFTACQFGTDGTNVIHGVHSLDHLKSKQIYIHRITNARSSRRHLKKYLLNGYTISNEQHVKFIDHCENCEANSDFNKKAGLGTYGEPIATNTTTAAVAEHGTLTGNWTVNVGEQTVREGTIGEPLTGIPGGQGLEYITPTYYHQTFNTERAREIPIPPIDPNILDDPAGFAPELNNPTQEERI